ncbi:hypothetical protein M408DRAFT_25117 [Serendipita vermifera MAFF 305830]|uniref:Calcium-transporting ATPase n=1 Tax=Serendipita vermifera MAFF 305830 TaxID=933852 RepID=A0A0C2XCG8_SERVB|nr:hypothetical protein M408DRAFT_25117 [Serendipita vermifera MAFF 305830]
MSSNASIPAITIDNSAVPENVNDLDHSRPVHQRSPSDPTYLLPTVPVSHSSYNQPPSPTESTNHFKFNTSVALRDNQPQAHSGKGTLSFLSPGTAQSKHGRRNSGASVGSTEGTETDHVPQTPSEKRRFNNEGVSETTHGAAEAGEDGTPAEISDVADPAPFTVRPKQLSEMVDNKSIDDLSALGGPEGLMKSLGTHPSNGLSGHAIGEGEGGGEGAYSATPEDRKRVYGINQMPIMKSKTLLQLMWLALQDKILILLSIAAFVSLALGLYQDHGVNEPTPCPYVRSQQCPRQKVDFVEGVAIIIAILIVVLVGSINDWQKERQFRALNEKKDDRTVKVCRNGQERQINIKDVMVGDIAFMEPGEILPCDGVFIEGHNLKCDESGATGESDAIKKVSYEEVLKDKDGKKDCFLLSGSKVQEGVGSYVVIAVGERSFNGRILMALRKPIAATPLQEKLNKLADLIAKFGGGAGLILFTALMIKFFVQLKTDPDRTPNAKAMAFLQILIISVTLVVVAVPEGLPLAVTLALAFATKRMTQENLLVRVLDSCETMANATVVCTDKTGTLTQNIMTVVAGSVGVHAKFVKNLKENMNRADTKEEPGVADANRKHAEDFSIEQDELNKILSPSLTLLFNEAIAVNSTAFEDVDKETGKVEFVGSKTETALLKFAKDLEWPGYKDTRAAVEIVQLLPFASERKYMGAMVKKGDKFRVYFKGASEILTKECKYHVVVGSPEHPLTGTEGDLIETKEINEKTKENIANTIIFYANQMLRTIAICYRDIDSWPPAGKSVDDVPLSELANNLTLISITGIEDPLRSSVRSAISEASRAGVVVKMCTGDNVLTARSIAAQCGIYTAGGVIMEGPVFRRLTKSEREEVVPHLQVLARSSPDDKRVLVETLMSMGEVVGVTGDGTNDGPALKEANVGFSMGIAGTEVAKEASDIILMDDNFASIVSAIIWGRCVNDSVRKFLQFQISVNICAIVITFISSVSSETESSVLTAVQLLWINIIMDTFAALALATDPATKALLNRKPDRRNAPLFTLEMSKMIICQSAYQSFVILLFHFAGPGFFGYEHGDIHMSTLVFNIFVWCQIFNSVNCRTIDGSKNVFHGLTHNYWFIIITLLECVIQVLIVFFGTFVFNVTQISGMFWGISIALGFASLPVGFLVRLIPNESIERVLVALHIMRDPNQLPTVDPDAEKYPSAVQSVRDDLSIFANIRGGRVRASSMALKSRNKRMKDANIRLPTLMTMVPALVASSVGARWTANPSQLHDPGNTDPSRSSTALWEGKLQLHPDTKRDHPAYTKWGAQVDQRPSMDNANSQHRQQPVKL